MALIVQASQSNPLIAGVPFGSIPPSVVANSGPTTTTASVDNETNTFQFIAGWLLLLLVLTLANRTRMGHVIIYYSLCLMILLILVTEYQQIVPLLNAAQTIGQFNTANSSSSTNFTQTK